MPKTEYLQGALDLLVLKTLALGPNHGWGIQQRFKQVSREALSVSQGSLYTALHRLEAAGLLASEMTASENNRKARFATCRFTTAVLLTLATGIGLTTANFSLLREVLIDPVPYPDASRLLLVWEDASSAGHPAEGREGREGGKGGIPATSSCPSRLSRPSRPLHSPHARSHRLPLVRHEESPGIRPHHRPDRSHRREERRS